MTTKLREILLEVQRLSADKAVEYEVLTAVAERYGIDIVPVVDDKTADNAVQTIRAFEIKGYTGFDCGWSTAMLYTSRTHEQSFTIPELESMREEFEPAGIHVYTSGFKGIKFTLHDFPLNVQSTTIQTLVMRKVLTHAVENLDLDFGFAIDERID